MNTLAIKVQLGGLQLWLTNMYEKFFGKAQIFKHGELWFK
jgi:hypothetical protein